MLTVRRDGNRDVHIGIARQNIESPARLGYYDAIFGRGFRSEYDTAPDVWQRNYETGRLWAIGFRRCHIAPPVWPAGAKSQPKEINEALARVNAELGALRPETTGPMADDPALPTLHYPVRVPRRRGGWRFTA